MLGFYPVGSEPLGGDVAAASETPPGGETGTNYIRCTLATHDGVPQANLATLCWALFSQLSPAQFEAPVAKGKYTMTPGSADVKIAVPAATVPSGWYFLVLSDEDGTTALAAPILVGP
jgi:hypothetical protein